MNKWIDYCYEILTLFAFLKHRQKTSNSLFTKQNVQFIKVDANPLYSIYYPMDNIHIVRVLFFQEELSVAYVWSLLLQPPSTSVHPQPMHKKLIVLCLWLWTKLCCLFNYRVQAVWSIVLCLARSLEVNAETGESRRIESLILIHRTIYYFWKKEMRWIVEKIFVLKFDLSARNRIK